MHKQTLQQPALGLVSTLVCLAISLAICSLFEVATFATWVTFLAITAIPTQMVLGLVWHYEYPGWLARLKQPGKGLASLVILLAAALLVAPASLAVVGGGMTPPLPFAIMFIILTVVTTIWLVVVFQCWPLAGLVKHPAAIGLGTLGVAYLLAWVLFRLGFSFEVMQGAPFYVAELDPRGAFMAWEALSFAVTTAAVIMGLVLLDFWPLGQLAQRAPAFGAQPLFGLVAGVLVLGIAGALWFVGVKVVQMDVVDYLVRVPVSLLFGEFIMLLLFQTAPLQAVPQPLKGIGLSVISAVLAVVMHSVYTLAAGWITGGLASGAPAYALELWLASAMLSVTFPVMVAYSGAFGFWPWHTQPATSAAQEAGESAAAPAAVQESAKAGS